MSIRESVPDGWRLLTMTEGRQIKEHLGDIIGDDARVAFAHGRLDGHAYGHLFREDEGNAQ